jgi:putative ABC transport system permease protein
MIKNYLKIAGRNIIKNKLFSIINIMGLAIGLACSMLILLWVQDELSFDKFHTNHATIYRVLQHMPFTEETTWAINQGPLAQALEDEVPEVEMAVRTSRIGFQLKYNDKEFNEGGIIADSSFLEMFTFQLTNGDAKTALSEPMSVVLTESFASKIFGDEDPLGKMILVYDQFNMVVSGVVENPPLNSHLDFEFISTMAFAGELGYTIDKWNNSSFVTYVLLDDNATLSIVNDKVKNILDNKPTLEEGAFLSLQPLDDIHLSSGIDFESSRTGNKQYVNIFFTSAIFILLIACINFMNMSTAQAMRRAREVGLRKAIGAEKGQLIVQFLFETTILALFSLFLAIILIEAVIPYFNDFSGKLMAVQYFDGTYILAFIILIVFTSLLAGAYPAFYISSFLPIKVLKGTNVTSSGNTGFRKFLVVLQFSISIILLIGTVVVYSQVHFMRNKDLGFNKDNLFYLNISNARQQLDALKNDLLANPNIQLAAGSSVLSGYNWANNQWKWEGKNTDLLFRGTTIDYDYFETLGIEMAKGRGFSRDFGSDSSAVILNEAAIRMMGLEDPIGKEFTQMRDDGQSFKIIGVVKDYNFRSLHSAIEPLQLFLNPSGSNYLWLRLSNNDVDNTISFIESSFKKHDPDHEFQYGFLDQRMENMYQQEARIGSILQAFSVLALIILCLGLYGLLGFTVTQRYREISIRKVFGASTGIILFLLSKGYFRLMLIAIVIAVPISNYIIQDWLDTFAYSIEISVLTFLLPALAMILISSIIVIGQSVKASNTNITELLRNE